MDPWHERIERARTLSAAYVQASDILTFYAALAAYQSSLVPPQAVARRRNAFIDDIDLQAAVRAVPPFLDWLRSTAPPPLAAAAADAASLEAGSWHTLMEQRLAHQDIDVPLDFIVEAVLQPFAEAAASSFRRRDSRAVSDEPQTSSPRCPVCGSLPACGVLREEGHGARRSLVCSLCLTEWEYLRVVCPACDEKRFDALPVYTADTYQQTRVDACDSCRVYLKTIDLTKDGLAVPIVDDLATLPLDLWARQAGYRRLSPNLLRL